MSHEAQGWAISCRIGNATRKLILWGLAGPAHHDGTGAWPSVKTLAKYAECDLRTAQRHLARLLADGYIREGDQRCVAHLDRRYRPIVYDLAMDAATVERWRQEHAAGRDGRRAKAEAVGARGGAVAAGSRGGESGRGGNLSPLETEPRGDSPVLPGVTIGASRGDRALSPESSMEPSREPPGDTHQHTADPVAEAARAAVAVGWDDPDTLDEHAFVLMAFRVANRGMCDNPLLEGSFEPVAPGGDARGYQAVRDWMAEGRPRRVILRAVYRAARDYQPSEDSPQIRRMGYFSAAVRRAAERHAAGLLEAPPAPEPGTQAEFTLRDYRRETPGAHRKGTGSAPAPIGAALPQHVIDAQRVADWQRANRDEAEGIRADEERAVREERPGRSEVEVRTLAKARAHQRILNLLPGTGEPAAAPP